MVNKKINPKKVTGSRLASNEIKIQQLKNGQYTFTFPKTIANIYGLKKGSVIAFRINENGKLELKKK